MDGSMDVPTDGHFRPLVMLLGGLLWVDLLKGHFLEDRVYSYQHWTTVTCRLSLSVRYSPALVSCKQLHTKQAEMQKSKASTSTRSRHYKGSCDNLEDKVLTLNHLPQLVSDPLTSWWVWPASQCQTPVPGHGGQHGESSTLRTSGLATVLTASIINVSAIEHQERSHQHCLQHLHRQITQLLQQQHHLHFHNTKTTLLSVECPTKFRRWNSTIMVIYGKPQFCLISNHIDINC